MEAQSRTLLPVDARNLEQNSSRATAEQVKRVLEAKLALGDVGFLSDRDEVPTFGNYSERWLKEYAEVNLKESSVVKHEQVLRLHILPMFKSKRLDEITRDDLKRFLAEVASKPKDAAKKDRGRGRASARTDRELVTQQRQADSFHLASGFGSCGRRRPPAGQSCRSARAICEGIEREVHSVATYGRRGAAVP
jgi:hypothetical protein